MAEADQTRIAQRFIEIVPLARAMGMRLVRVDDDGVEITMPWTAGLAGDTQGGAVHGGAVFALLDSACGAAVLSAPGRPASTATLDLRVEHLRPARPGHELRAMARCRHVARHAISVTASAWDGDADQPFALASGVFTNGR